MSTTAQAAPEARTESENEGARLDASGNQEGTRETVAAKGATLHHRPTESARSVSRRGGPFRPEAWRILTRRENPGGLGIAAMLTVRERELLKAAEAAKAAGIAHAVAQAETLKARIAYDLAGSKEREASAALTGCTNAFIRLIHGDD